MKKDQNFSLLLYFMSSRIFIFSLNPKVLKQIKHKIYDYLEIIENKYIKITKSIPIKESQLIPKGYLTTHIISKKHYTLGYAESARQSEWAAYPLKREMVELALTLLKSKKLKGVLNSLKTPTSKAFFQNLKITLKAVMTEGT